jgi:tetratricopeptide (TPR) repeat protein
MANEIQPYVGPRPFELKDRDIFFGREEEARDLLSLVIANNVVLVYSQSGVGKTSLLNARLVPMLEEKGFEVFPVARVKGITTGKLKIEDIPNIFVFNTLISWSEGEKSLDLEKLSQMTLENFLNERKHQVDDTGQKLPRAIIFDQFEELFSSYQHRWKDRTGFFKQIGDVLDIPLLRLVFFMREEFIAQLDPYVNLLPEMLRTRFRLERLNQEAALLAVKEPLKNTGRYFAEGVAEKLVEDLLKIRVETNPGETVEVNGEFIEAVQLQVVCQNLWLGLPEDVIEINMQKLDTYGNVGMALFRFYDEALREAVQISHIDEERLRNWFEEILITSIGTRGTVFRSKDYTGLISNKAIDVLESKHLIRAEIRAGARWYELTHDKFIEPILSSNEFYRSQLRDSMEMVPKILSMRAKAEQMWGEKNYEEALKWFEKILAKYEDIDDNSGRVNTYIAIGNIYYETEKYRLMIETCEKALKIDTNCADAYYNWGRSLRKLSRYDEAIKKYQKVIEIDPNYVEAHNGWGNALSDLRKYDEAIDKYKKAIEIDSKYVECWYNWGIALSDLKKYDEAIEKYEKVIEIDPNFAAAWYNKASSLCLANGDIEEISTCLARAIELDSFYIQMAEEDLVFKSVKNQMWFKNLSN